MALLPGLFRQELPSTAAAIPKAAELADLCQTPKSCSGKVSVLQQVLKVVFASGHRGLRKQLSFPGETTMEPTAKQQ